MISCPATWLVGVPWEYAWMGGVGNELNHNAQGKCGWHTGFSWLIMVVACAGLMESISYVPVTITESGNVITIFSSIVTLFVTVSRSWHVCLPFTGRYFRAHAEPP